MTTQSDSDHKEVLSGTPTVDLTRQGRFAHFTQEDIAHFQQRVDESWEKWWIPGVIPFTMSEE